MTFDEQHKEKYFEFQTQPSSSRTPRVSDGLLSGSEGGLRQEDLQNFHSAEAKLQSSV